MWQIFSSLMFQLLTVIVLSNLLPTEISGMAMGFSFPLLLCYATQPLLAHLVIDVVQEKEQKMKEIMHIYGISELVII